MKTRKINFRLISSVLCAVALLMYSCDRDITDEAEAAGFPPNGEVFIDTFSSGLEYYPFGDSFFEAFSVSNDAYDGLASMRFDVPNFGDPGGPYAGAIFRDDNGGRDLTGFDALTFWAKGTVPGTIDNIGFGVDFFGDAYRVSLPQLQLTTNWRKYVVPIPDASKLSQVQGLLWYAEGPEDGDGYSFWLDEVQFEKLGTFANPRPKIFNGDDAVQTSFVGANTSVTGLTQTFNSGSGNDITVAAAPAYFEFNSSNPSVATVDEFGSVIITGAGTTVITASLNGVDAEGSLTLESLGNFDPAPIPDEDPANVISIFSDAYDNVPVDYYNGYFAPFQTTQGQDDLNINGDNIINYTDLNFVGIGTFLNVPTVNASAMTHFHADINIREDVDPGDFIRLELINGVATPNEISGSIIIPSSELVGNEWISLDIPLADFAAAGLSVRDALGLIFFVSDATISEIYVDNIYYYQEVIDPSPNVDDSAATEVALPIGWESTSLTYNFLGFEGADSAIETNPDQSGINPTATVMRSTKTPGAQFFAGTLLNLDSPIDFSTSQKLRMKVWSPKLGIPIKVRLEDEFNTAGIEVDANNLTQNGWEEMQWDFGSVYNPAVDYVRVVVFFEFIPGLPGDGSTYYYDDIQIVD